jgi:hypothetical protein
VDVAIEWPSGVETNLNDVDLNRLHDLVEPAG